MFEEEFKTELMAFLSKDDVDLITLDVTNIIKKFPLDDPKKKNYLNILINVFLRYRINLVAEVSDLVNLPLLEIGSNPKEIVIKQNKTKINFLEFKNMDKYFVKSDLSNLDKYFREIAFKVDQTSQMIDFSRNSYEQRMSQAINDYGAGVFDLEGFFYTYINSPLETNNVEFFLPERKDNDEVLLKIQEIIRFYAWGRSSLAWSEFLNSDKEIQSLSDNYQALQWFFDGYIKRSTPFNVHSPKRYGQYIESLKSSMNSKKRVQEVFEFTNALIDKIKDIYSLLNNSPFAVQKENKSNLFEIFKKIISLQTYLSEKDSYTLDTVVQHYNSLKTIFIELDLKLDELYELNSNNIIEKLLLTVVKQIENKELPVEFPFTLIWQSKDEELVSNYMKNHSLSVEGPNLQMLEFLVEYNHGGISRDNFSNYFSKMETIDILQKKLLEIGDIPDYDIVKFDDANYLVEKSENYDFMDFKKLNEVENNIRQSLNILKRIWVHDICGDPIFINDPSFKKFFPLELGKDKIEYVSELQTYLEKWNTYKENSNAIKKLQETIKIVSTIKLKLEGEELISSDYPGAVSLIKAQKLITRENSRLLLKLKDLILSVSKFKYNEGFSHNIDVQLVNKSDNVLIKQSLNIIDQLEELTQDLKVIDIPTFSSELKVLSDFMSSLLGADAKVTQLKKFADTLEVRHEKLTNDPVLSNVGLHFSNMNDAISNITSILKSFNENLQKFYSNSLEKDIIEKFSKISTTRNLSVLVTDLQEINSKLNSVVEKLSETFSDVTTYFDVFADIAFRMMQKYSRLVSRNDFYSRIDNSRIKFYEDEGSIIITDKIKENSSILEKQIFMEKTFSLYTIVSRACGQINFALSKSFDNLILAEKFSSEKLDRNQEVAKKVEIITKSVDDFYKFLDSIKLPSRKYIQGIKGSLKNTLEAIKPIKPTAKLVAELSNANKLINAISKNKGSVNYGLLRKLNDSMNKILRYIDSSVLVHFTELVADEKKKKELLSFIKPDDSLSSYSRKLDYKILKIKSILNTSIELLKNKPLEEVVLSNQISVKEIVQERPVQEALVEESTPEVVQEAVEEAVAEEVIEEAIEEAVAEEVIEEAVEEAVAEEVIEEAVEEAVAEEVIEEAVEEAVVEEVIEEAVEEAVAEEIVQEPVEEEPEAFQEESEEKLEIPEPNLNQLQEENEENLELETEEDTYEPEQESDDSDNDSGDLISEMERLLNADSPKKENSK